MIVAAPKGEEEDEIPPANILKHLRDRGLTDRRRTRLMVDSKIQILEWEVKRMNDQFYRLKEELVPVFKYTRAKVYPYSDISLPPRALQSELTPYIYLLSSLLTRVNLAYLSLYPRPTCPPPPQHPPQAVPASLANSLQRNSSLAVEVANPLTTAPQWKSPNHSCHQLTSTASPTSEDLNPLEVQQNQAPL